MPATERPLCFTFLVCDQVVTEEGTSKKTLVGTFNRIRVPTFPLFLPSLTVFVSLTNGRGKMPGALQLTGPNQEAPVLQIQGELNFNDPTAVIEASFKLNNVPFTTAGIYHFQFLVDGEIISTRPIIVVSSEETHDE